MTNKLQGTVIVSNDCCSSDWCDCCCCCCCCQCCCYQNCHVYGYWFVTGISWRTVGDESRFCTERNIFSFNPHVTAGKQKPQGHGFHADVISPWTTKLPSMVRPRHSCGAQVVGKYNSIHYLQKANSSKKTSPVKRPFQ